MGGVERRNLEFGMRNAEWVARGEWHGVRFLFGLRGCDTEPAGEFLSNQFREAP